jgi:hypothetical protein
MHVDDTLPARPELSIEMGEKTGVFAALLAEVWAHSEESLEGDAEGAEEAFGSEGGAGPHGSRYVVQLPLPGVGARALFVERRPSRAAEAGAGERWVTRELGRLEQRPGVRRRQERIHALKGRFERQPRPAVELGGEVHRPARTSETKCIRAPHAGLAHEAVLVIRAHAPRTGGPGLADEQGLIGGLRAVELSDVDVAPQESSDCCSLELARCVVVRPGGLVAHLRALDGALAQHGT